MPRDTGLEEVIREYLADTAGLVEARMFGGLAWMMDGHLLCAASSRGALVRLGKGNDGWALERDGVESLAMKGRAMPGWVRVDAEVFADEALAGRLIEEAVVFVRSLPDKI